MTKSRVCFQVPAICLAFAALGASQAAWASDTPVIWTPRQVSDTSYAMRMGSRLPLELEASAGAEVSFSRRQISTRTAHPVKFWGSVKLPPSAKKADDGVRIEMRLNGLTGRRSVWMNKSRSLVLTPDLAAQIEDLYSLDYDRAADDRRLNARIARTVRLISNGSRTSLIARGSRSSGDREWQASLGVEKKAVLGINLSANIENLAARRPNGTLRASFAQNW